MSNLVSQIFQEQEVRFVGTAESPEWVAADIVAILYPDADRRNYSNHLSKIQPEWKDHKNLITPGGMQSMTTIYEPGVYVLIARSNSPFAVPFQKWMFEEVLPAIRRQGFYLDSSVEASKLVTAFSELSWKEKIAAAISLASVPGAVDALALLEGKTVASTAPAVKKTVKPRQKPKKALFIPGWSDSPKPESPWTDADIERYVRLRNNVEPLTGADAYRIAKVLHRKNLGVYRVAAAIRKL